MNSMAPIDPAGNFTVVDGISAPGNYVDITADMDVIFVISNCPQVNNPCSGGKPTAIRIEVTVMSETGASKKITPSLCRARVARHAARLSGSTRSAGNATVTVVPTPSVLSISRRPPWSSIRRADSGKPRPVPVYFRLSWLST